MKHEDLLINAEKLKDSIVESINHFRHETGVIPNVSIKIKEVAFAPCHVQTLVEVVVNVDL